MGELPFGDADTTAVAAPAPAETLRQRLIDELRERLLEQGEQPPLRNRAVLGRVVALCRDPNGSARGVAVEAARDEAFAALLLRASTTSPIGSSSAWPRSSSGWARSPSRAPNTAGRHSASPPHRAPGPST